MMCVDGDTMPVASLPQTLDAGSLAAAAAAGSTRPVLLRAEDLKIAFGGVTVLDGVDVELRRGDVVLLRGENGSGKTTLLNILTGNLEPDAGAIHYLTGARAHAYVFPRRWWQRVNPFDHFTPELVARTGVGRSWQDVRLFGALSLRDNVAVAEPDPRAENPLLALFAGGSTARRGAKVNARIDALLADFGLAGREGSSADKVSLGQSKRVAIARAVAAGARVLFLDEPLAGLDGDGIADVLGLLETLVRLHAITLVIVEHVFNQPHLRGLVTRDWLLAGGRLRETSAPSPDAAPASADRPRPEWLSLLAPADAAVVHETLPRGAVLTRIRRPLNTQAAPPPVLDVRGLMVRRGPRTVIGIDDHGAPDGFDLTLYAGDVNVLQAPNGWGKTTLFGAIAGLVPVDAGEIRLGGERLNGLAPWVRVRRGILALPSGFELFPNLLAREVLQLAGVAHARAVLGPLANRPCGSLSGGQKKRVAIASTMGHPGARARLFDEPFAMLDRAAIAETLSLLTPASDATVLIFLPSSTAIEQTRTQT